MTLRPCLETLEPLRWSPVEQDGSSQPLLGVIESACARAKTVHCRLTVPLLSILEGDSACLKTQLGSEASEFAVSDGA